MTAYREFVARCPACATPMAAQALSPGLEGAACPSGHGVWVGGAELPRLLALGGASHPELLEHDDGEPHRGCAVCRAPMHHVWLDFVRFERCAEHGAWLEGSRLALVREQLLAPLVTKKELQPVLDFTLLNPNRRRRR